MVPALTLALSSAPAAAESLVTTLSTESVAITSTYTGAEITAFGVIERDGQTSVRVKPYDVVISARGPRRTTIVREKEQLGPNLDQSLAAPLHRPARLPDDPRDAADR